MTKQQQIQYLSALSNSILSDMIKKIEANKVPDNWDGFELRQWLHDSTISPIRMSKKQKRDYNRIMITADL